VFHRQFSRIGLNPTIRLHPALTKASQMNPHVTHTHNATVQISQVVETFLRRLRNIDRDSHTLPNYWLVEAGGDLRSPYRHLMSSAHGAGGSLSPRELAAAGHERLWLYQTYAGLGGRGGNALVGRHLDRLFSGVRRVVGLVAHERAFQWVTGHRQTPRCAAFVRPTSTCPPKSPPPPEEAPSHLPGKTGRPPGADGTASQWPDGAHGAQGGGGGRSVAPSCPCRLSSTDLPRAALSPRQKTPEHRKLEASDRLHLEAVPMLAVFLLSIFLILIRLTFFLAY